MKKNSMLLILMEMAVLNACTLPINAPLVPPTAAEDPSIPSISVTVAGRSRKVHLRSFGDPSNPLLMVAPGSLSDIRAFLNFRKFSDKYHVVLWDMRGCGLSERVCAEELAVPVMVDEMHQIKMLFSPDAPATVVGHSWSASFGALYCAAWPEDTIQAVLIEPPGLKSEYMEELDQIMNLTSIGYCDMNWFQSTLSPTDHEKLDFQMLAMLEAGVRDFFVDINNKPRWPVWRVGGLALLVWEKSIISSGGTWDFDYTPGLKEYPNSVLLVGSSHSPIGYEFQKDYNGKAFTSPELLYIGNSGHRIPVEQWEVLETGLRAYLLEYR